MDNQSLIFLPQIADGEDKHSILKNRLRKNYRHLRKWAKRTITDSFRIYDREIKQYPLAIDFYAGRYCVHFFAKGEEGDQELLLLRAEVNQVLVELFDANIATIYWRIRSKFKETRQYEKLDSAKDFFIVHEYGVKFNVNLTDYLDTGLFLDHRETRQLVSKACVGKRLLNLFAYTCSFSVQAAQAGALATKSVDMSNTYMEWGRKNFILNNFSLHAHALIRADCLKFLEVEVSKQIHYDVIVIDPPTISRSKKNGSII